ncbi:ornithine cyclodeaminase, putative [Ricinus communis]|uniref:Ornithine cyclodeaminase, putative n=1 Tax=Ricinus communis TaxID=3988 RepID=B9RIS1_RICCO|nr:ornithine cyclodeaminase, putative [Ricinus communis]|eukprot:XP_002513640.1 protein SAR DEFICIENT 4 [Ricinus communis]
MASIPSQANSISSSPIFITRESLHSILSHHSLIQHFRISLSTVSPTLHTPIRQSYGVSPSSSLLLMPSWSSSPSLPYIGVKLVTHFPQNSMLNLPGIHASYVLFSSTTGQTLASMDGTALTLYRTSCVSGLASRFLARDNSKVLVMIGAGALAPHLIKAHLAANPSLEKVIIWNRTMEKAADLAEKLREEYIENDQVCFQSNDNLEEIIGLGDIVSCATNADTPLVKGEKLKPGAHLDLVGSFKETMRECDDEAIKRGRVFVDNEAALVEAGEIVGALHRGVIEKKDIRYLAELIKGDEAGRTDSEEITVFKSVGSALVDMLAAQLVYELYMKG